MNSDKIPSACSWLIGGLVAALEGDGPDHHHVVDGRQRRADERTNPEDPVVFSLGGH